ncbi:MAG: hypothetical protein RL514_1412 [Verrucomicrobiota bacterium]|jgi:type 1 glutamine amidotransferase
MNGHRFFPLGYNRLRRLAVLRLAFASWLLALAPLGFAAESKRLLIIGQGPDGHPPGTHEFMPGARVVERLLKPFPAVQTTLLRADEPWADGPALLDQADGVVLLVTQGAEFMQRNPARHEAFKRLAARKGGLVALHWSVGAKDAKFIPGQLELLGGTRGGPQRKYKVLETDVTVANRQHPVVAGLANFRVHDEFYYRLDLKTGAPGFTPLLTARVEDQDEVACWAWQRPDGGRSFGYVGLHFHAHWGREDYQRLVTQAVLWTLGQPIPKDGVKVGVEPAVLERLKP